MSNYPLFKILEGDPVKKVYVSTHIYLLLQHKSDDLLRELRRLEIDLKPKASLADDYTETRYKSGRVIIQRINLEEQNEKNNENRI